MPGKGFKIGLCWRGSQDFRIDPRRSIPPSALGPLAALPGVELYALHMDVGADELPAQVATKVHVFADGFDRGPDAFVDTAAVMANLDLVVTCDTSIAHLAGAMGRPVWVTLRHYAEWRWMLEREDSPWYPTMRLLRAKAGDDWFELYERLARDVALLAQGKSKHLMIEAPISWGELVDKITILEIKTERINDPKKLTNVTRELWLLNQKLSEVATQVLQLKLRLKEINTRLWNIEDEIRDCERQKNFGPRFIELARAVYITNDLRADVKREINVALSSELVEEKSYRPYA
jgi:chaperonin cofactor prefoldin